MPVIQRRSPAGRLVKVTVGKSVRISNSALFESRVRLGDNVTIGPDVVIESGSYIGNFCKVGKGSRIGQDVRLIKHVELGDDCIIANKARLTHSDLQLGVRIGRETTLNHASFGVGASVGNGSTIGYHVGFDIDPRDQERESSVSYKVTFGHRATIGDNVEIKDPGVFGDSVSIGNSTKITDDRLGYRREESIPHRIAHHSSVGSNCIISCSHIGEDVTIGDNARIFWSTVERSCTIGDNVSIGMEQRWRLGQAPERGYLRQFVTLGDNIIVRPTVTVPAYWCIPADYVANPGPDKNAPFLVANAAPTPRT